MQVKKEKGMAKWKIEIESVNGCRTTMDTINNISDPDRMISELGKAKVAMAFGTGRNERMIFPYATVVSIKITKVEEENS